MDFDHDGEEEVTKFVPEWKRDSLRSTQDDRSFNEGGDETESAI